jgi:hypothetical protein
MTIKGKNVDRNSRFIDTWIFQNGHWECVASQSTLTSPLLSSYELDAV